MSNSITQDMAYRQSLMKYAEKFGVSHTMRKMGLFTVEKPKKRYIPKPYEQMTLFEKTAAELGIRHKLIRPYTPRHNGKAERSHREDQKRFYSCHSFYSLADFEKQLAVHNRRSNNLPMRPLHWLSPSEFFVQYV